MYFATQFGRLHSNRVVTLQSHLQMKHCPVPSLLNQNLKMFDHPTGRIDSEVVKHFNKTSWATLLLGGFPLKLKNDDLIISFWGLSGTFFLITLLMTSAVIQIYSPGEMAICTIVECILIWLDYGLLHLAVFVFLFKAIRHRRLVFNIIQELSQIKIFLELSGIDWKPRSKAYIAGFLTLVIFATKIYQPFQFYITLGYAANFIAFYYLIFIIIWVVCQFMWFADLLKHCFEGIARRVKGAESGVELQHLMKLHYLVSAVSNQLSSLYSFLLTVSFIAFFFMALTRGYVLITYAPTRTYIFLKYLNILMAVILVLLCYGIVSSCEQVRNKVRDLVFVLF